MNRLAPQTDAAHLAAVKQYLADHLRGAPMPDVWLESLEVVIRMAENNGRSSEAGKSVPDPQQTPTVSGMSADEPPAQPGSDTPKVIADPHAKIESLAAQVTWLKRELEAERRRSGNVIRDWGEMAQQLAAAKEEIQGYREAMGQAIAKQARLAEELAAAKEDAERLDWCMKHISGRAWREAGVYYAGGCDRAAIDAARRAEEK